MVAIKLHPTSRKLFSFTSSIIIHSLLAPLAQRVAPIYLHTLASHKESAYLIHCLEQHGVYDFAGTFCLMTAMKSTLMIIPMTPVKRVSRHDRSPERCAKAKHSFTGNAFLNSIVSSGMSLRVLQSRDDRKALTGLSSGFTENIAHRQSFTGIHQV